MTATTRPPRASVLGFTNRITLASLFLLAASISSAQENWVNKRTPDGQPDLQGLWTNETTTPMERAVELGEKAFFTKAEIQALKEQAAQSRAASENAEADTSLPPAGGNIGAYNAIWLDLGDSVMSTGQTSLIVDPPNGRAPIREAAWEIRESRAQHLEDDYLNHTVWDRCITRGVPGAMLPAAYNNAYRIIQTPGFITILYEMIHEVRIIPLKKSNPIDEKVKLWMGDSVAHWEADTLIIETTNFNDKGMIANSGGGGRLKGLPSSKDLHVVERFTRTGEDTIIWQARITDPVSFTQPTTISMPLTRDPEYVIYEYACHEGNHAIRNILSAGRTREAREAAAR
jgi:hypothetical protein